MQRAARSGFMGGAYVFPGGRLDEGDGAPGGAAHCDGADLAARRLSSLSSGEAVRYHVAAIREMFEECGLLLARDGDGQMVSPDEASMVDARHAVQRGARTIWSVVDQHGWRLALDALVPFAHWVTPEFERRRFDTRFFAARVPAGQTARHDATETVESVWVSPSNAIALDARGTIALPLPTWRTLSDLQPFQSVDDALAWAEAEPQLRREPRFVEDGDARMLVLPGDPLYPASIGEALTGGTRFVWEADRWRVRL